MQPSMLVALRLKRVGEAKPKKLPRPKNKGLRPCLTVVRPSCTISLRMKGQAGW
jgi:hypothetical protein